MTQRLQQKKLVLEEGSSKNLVILDTVWAGTLFLTMNNLNSRMTQVFGMQLGAENCRLDSRPFGLDSIYRIWKKLCNGHNFSLWKKTQDISWFTQLGSAFSE